MFLCDIEIKLVLIQEKRKKETKTTINQSPFALCSLTGRRETLKKESEGILKGSGKPTAQHIVRKEYFQHLAPSRHSINPCWLGGSKQIVMTDATWELIAKPIRRTTWGSKAKLTRPTRKHFHGMRVSRCLGWKAAEENIVKCGQCASRSQMEFLPLHNFWNCLYSGCIKCWGNCFWVFAREFLPLLSTSVYVHR